MTTLDLTLARPARAALSLRRFDPVEARALFRLALPITLTALLSMGMSVTDAFFVAALGMQAFAAVAVASDFYSLVFYLAGGVVAGLSAVLAAAVARGERARSRSLVRAGLLVSALLAAIGAPLVALQSVPLAALGLERALLEDGTGYARAMALNLVPMLFVAFFRTVLVAHERPVALLRATLLALPLNALLDVVLIHGLGPLPAFGATGAGIASIGVSTFTAVALVVPLRRLLSERPGVDEGDERAPGAAGPRPHDRLAAADVARILRVGLPIGIATLGEVGVFLAATLLAARLAGPDVAAHALALRLAGVLYALPFGLSQAAAVRTARAQGVARRRRVVATALSIAAVAGLTLAALTAALAAPLAALLDDGSTAGASAAAIAVPVLLVLALTQCIDPLGGVAAGLLRGVEDTRAPMRYALVAYWLVAAPLGIALVTWTGAGALGIWGALALGTLCATLPTIRRLWQST